MPTGLVSCVVRAHKPAMAWLLPYRDLFTALAIGLLIGLERGWQQRGVRPGGRVAALRTFGLVGLWGGTTGMLGAQQPLLAAMVFPRLATIIVPGALVAAGFAPMELRAVHTGPVPALPETRNPFALLPALGFAALVAALALAVRWAESRCGDTGIVTVLAITGSMDVDAAIVTLRGLAPGTIDPELAGTILALPVLLNTLFKAAIVLLKAGWQAGWPAALPLAAAAILPVALLLTR
jgi:uncharacterized membrane protein (DUF4010 family)